MDDHGNAFVARPVNDEYSTIMHGAVLDEWTFDGAEHGNESLAASPDGLIALAGSSASLATGGNEPVLLLYGPPGPAPDPTFAQWAKLHGLAGDAAGFTADPDRDGIANGLEFAIGLDPTVARPAWPPPSRPSTTTGSA